MGHDTNKIEKIQKKKHRNNRFKMFEDVISEISNDNKPLFYFYCVCLFSHEEVLKKILTIFFNKNKKIEIDNIYHARTTIMNIIFDQTQDNKKYLNNALNFFRKYIYPSIEYFKISKNTPFQIAELLSEVLWTTLSSNRIYYWNYHYLFEITFQNGLFTEDDVVSKRYNIKIIDETYMVIEGHNKKIRYDKFVNYHPKSRLSDYERYMNFYKSLVTALYHKNGTYCGICRPYGRKPINPNTGKTVTSHPCQNCTEIFNSIYNLLKHDAEAVGRIKDNITKIHYNANDNSYINKRINAFIRSFDREILKHNLDEKNLKSNISEQEYKKISEKINLIKETMISRMKTVSSKE